MSTLINAVFDIHSPQGEYYKSSRQEEPTVILKRYDTKQYETTWRLAWVISPQ